MSSVDSSAKTHEETRKGLANFVFLDVSKWINLSPAKTSRPVDHINSLASSQVSGYYRGQPNIRVPVDKIRPYAVSWQSPGTPIPVVPPERLFAPALIVH
jgi:hypothetical protein